MDEIKRDGYHLFNAGSKKKPRIIEAPSVALKERQKWIATRILNDGDIGSWVHGYVKNKSIVTNAKVHAGKNYILCLDIKNYFMSFTFDMVVGLFMKVGYSESASRELASICTFSYDLLCFDNEEVPENLCFEKYLPHGAPSSPLISNLIFQEVDCKIIDVLSGKDIRYTRYADDMVFSSNSDDLIWLIESVKKIVVEKGFQINENKVKLMGKNDLKLLMGLNITSDLRLQNAYKRELRKEIFYCKKYGIQNHLEKTEKNHKSNFKGYIYGKAYFVKMVEPILGEKFLAELDDIFLHDNYMC